MDPVAELVFGYLFSKNLVQTAVAFKQELEFQPKQKASGNTSSRIKSKLEDLLESYGEIRSADATDFDNAGHAGNARRPSADVSKRRSSVEPAVVPSRAVAREDGLKGPDNDLEPALDSDEWSNDEDAGYVRVPAQNGPAGAYAHRSNDSDSETPYEFDPYEGTAKPRHPRSGLGYGGNDGDSGRPSVGNGANFHPRSAAIPMPAAAVGDRKPKGDDFDDEWEGDRFMTPSASFVLTPTLVPELSSRLSQPSSTPRSGSAASSDSERRQHETRPPHSAQPSNVAAHLPSVPSDKPPTPVGANSRHNESFASEDVEDEQLNEIMRDQIQLQRDEYYQQESDSSGGSGNHWEHRTRPNLPLSSAVPDLADADRRRFSEFDEDDAADDAGSVVSDHDFAAASPPDAAAGLALDELSDDDEDRDAPSPVDSASVVSSNEFHSLHSSDNEQNDPDGDPDVDRDEHNDNNDGDDNERDERHDDDDDRDDEDEEDDDDEEEDVADSADPPDAPVSSESYEDRESDPNADDSEALPPSAPRAAWPVHPLQVSSADAGVADGYAKRPGPHYTILPNPSMAYADPATYDVQYVQELVFENDDGEEPEVVMVAHPDAYKDHSVEYETFNLPIICEKEHTGLEEKKDFPVTINGLIAGRYQVLEYLGSAAFSKAVRCLDLQSGVQVCIKIIKNNKEFLDQSLDEIKLLKYLGSTSDPNEKNVLQIYDYFYHKEHLFIVSELLRDNLYKFYKYNRESGDELYFTIDRLRKISKQCLVALEYIHSLRIIHCDLKPENILVKSFSRCEVKIIDFGSSCFTRDHLSSYVQSRSYRAPEVMLGLPYDERIDIWSLGCIIAELWTGKVLFLNESIPTLLARIIGMFGPFEPELLKRARYASKYFSENNELYEPTEGSPGYVYLHPKRTSLKHRLKSDDPLFVDFLTQLLSVNPARRPNATEALQHPFLREPSV